jgi:TPR repeat protein
MKRAEVNDAFSICMLASCYYNGRVGFQLDHAKAMEQYARATNLGNSEAHYSLAGVYHQGGSLKKVKFHYEAAAMAGHEVARCHLGVMEGNSENKERAVKHWKIAAMQHFRLFLTRTCQ